MFLFSLRLFEAVGDNVVWVVPLRQHSSPTNELNKFRLFSALWARNEWVAFGPRRGKKYLQSVAAR